ncbi:MAG: penicillin-binding protein [Mucilaginibacter sp.]|nr:penicillin-binding protein [Mucilaginibacter sp.]
MTRSNLYIRLSNGNFLICVADSSSAPEQGYIVESLILPLLSLENAENELALITEHCTMNEQRINATYRYEINLKAKTVAFYEEHYHYKSDRFSVGENLTDRYSTYLLSIDNQTV